MSREACGSVGDSGKLIEHIYGFLIVVDRILQKYVDNKCKDISE